MSSCETPEVRCHISWTMTLASACCTVQCTKRLEDFVQSRVQCHSCPTPFAIPRPSYVSLDYKAQEGYILRLARDDEREGSKLTQILKFAAGQSVVSEFAGRKIVREPVPIEKDEPLKLELQHFVQCVREQQTPMVSGESAKRALDLAFEITRQVEKAHAEALDEIKVDPLR